MKVIELNRPAVSNRLSIKELSIRPYVAQMMYMDGSKIIQQATPEKPVYRLAKDYEVDGLQFGLNLLTDDNDAGKAEKYMDKIAKGFKRDEVRDLLGRSQPFVYLNKRYGDK